MRARKPFLAALVSVAILSLSSCTGGSGGGPPAPMFTSTPVLQASQGDLYTYLISATDPSGGAVTFELTAAPAEATLSGSTLTWTPAAAESRVPNSFTVTAKSSGGGMAMQSWMVTPSGTVILTRIDTHWTASGPVVVPFDWTKSPTVAALIGAFVQQPDGSFVFLSGSGSSDGTFMIPNVPGGFYFLRASPSATYWTSQSMFDIGADMAGPQALGTGTVSSTIFDVNDAGLDPLQEGDLFDFHLDFDFEALQTIVGLQGSTTLTTTIGLTSNFDLSAVQVAFMLQYEPLPLGPLNLLALGPGLVLQNAAFVNGATNAITATLNSTPKSSFDLSVQGSAWAPLLQSAGPVPPTTLGSTFGASVEPFVSGLNARHQVSILGPDLPLFSSATANSQTIAARATNCSDTQAPFVQIGGSSETAQAPILTDQDLGTVQYEDPFPSNWLQYFQFCQKAFLDIPVTGLASPATFLITDGRFTSVPSSAVAPLVTAPQNAKINGTDFFSAYTTNNPQITLTWSPPSVGTPFGYYVRPFVLVTLPDGTQQFARAGEFGTSKTTVTLPLMLKPGMIAIFVITAEVDGRASMESQPNRSLLPVAFASIVSAPVTIAADAQVPAMRGGAAGRELFLTPQPADDTEPPPRVETHRIR